eukprot:jgi/Tetstr1/453685/TSEL_040641.t1
MAVYTTDVADAVGIPGARGGGSLEHPVWPSVDGKHGAAGRSGDLGCAVCGATGLSLKTCDGCKGPRRYCGKACQVKDWKELGHKKECKRLQAAADQAAPRAARAAAVDKAEKLKSQGNNHLQREEWQQALDCYSEANALASGASMADVKARKAGHPGGAAADEPLPFSELELRASRLAAVAAVNSSVALARSGDPAAAASLAREALSLDPTYFEKAMHRLQQALSLLRDGAGSQAAAKKADAFSMSNNLRNGEPIGLLMADVVDLKMFRRLQAHRFRCVLEAERNKPDLLPHMVAYRPPSGSISDAFPRDTWTTVTARVSLLPFRCGQWLSCSICHAMAKPDPSMPDSGPAQINHLHFLPADPQGPSPNATTTTPAGLRGPGRSGTPTALAAARREIPRFLRRLEDMGVAAQTLQLGAGLLDLAPLCSPLASGLPTTDALELILPRPSSRMAARIAREPKVLDVALLPEYTYLLPDIHHVRREWGEIRRPSAEEERVMEEVNHSGSICGFAPAPGCEPVGWGTTQPADGQCPVQ